MTQPQPRKKVSRRLLWIVAAALAVLIAWIGIRQPVDGYHLAFAPRGMGIQTVLYVAEDSWGYNPSGNETGIVVYEMPDATAAVLQREGLKYLRTLPVKSWWPLGNMRHAGIYKTWQQTPLEIDRHWPQSRANSRKDWGEPDIGDYMDKWGFGIPVDASVLRLVNGALFSPGSYYAYGRWGLIILIPSEHRIVYVYAG